MNKFELKSNQAVDERYGVPVYQSNPSIPADTEIKRSKRAQIGTDMRGLVVDSGSGEILGHGGAIAYEWEEVDKERFVKLYLAGLKQAAGLSKAGLAVFEAVYTQVRERPGQDTVPLDSYSSSLHPVTYRRGLRELLEKEFLFRSPNPGLFFVNIRFMFNGDRLAFVKGYKLRKDQPTLPGLDMEPSSMAPMPPLL
ncbi:MAG: hypothetical protein JSR59_21455 [Proteobacteria bacterium]|nr:hypothetical protein [Pseudomonadota bacterium]